MQDHELCVTSGEHTKSNVDADYEDDLTDQSFAENLEDNDASTSAAGYQVRQMNKQTLITKGERHSPQPFVLVDHGKMIRGSMYVPGIRGDGCLYGWATELCNSQSQSW